MLQEVFEHQQYINGSDRIINEVLKYVSTKNDFIK